MIVREAYRDVTHAICRRHYDGELPMPCDAPALGPVIDARTVAVQVGPELLMVTCEFCDDGGDLGEDE